MSLKKIIKSYIIKTKYKNFNKKFFKRKKSDHEILIEFNSFRSSHLFLSVISNVISEKLNGKIVGYFNYSLTSVDLESSVYDKFKWLFGKFFGFNFFGIYKSFGVTKFIKPSFNKDICLRSDKIFNSLINQIKSKNDVLNLKINGIEFGDLIYDGYLKRYFKYSLEINNKEFHKYIKDFIKLYLFWNNYLDSNNVKAVVGVHTYYAYGVILRIALNKNIKVLTTESGKIFQLNKERNISNLEFKDLKYKIKSLNKNELETLIEKAKLSIENRFKGEISKNIDELVTTKSAYHNNYSAEKKVLAQNKKIKVLIATHNIGDACNAYGKNFFEDFYEWLLFLGSISKKTNYDWYIKDHPYYSDLKYASSLDRTYELSKKIVKQFNSIKRLDPNLSHHQLRNEGINFVLTIYGTISWEYAYYKIPVLTASNNCPTIDFNFNHHSSSKKKYEENLMNLDKIKVEIDRDEIINYYLAKYLIFNHNNLMKNFSNFLEDQTKNWDSYDTDDFYEYIYNTITKEDIVIMKNNIQNFIQSKEYIFVNQVYLNEIFLQYKK
tara:strand:- start:2854 stop:4503 length:1650 start_codon:yes stop_codon:yes gene_type:complete